MPQLQAALGFGAVYAPASSYLARASETADGVQVDLLFDRADRIITLVEVKFTEEPFVLTKVYAQQLREKKLRFRAHTGTKKAVTLALLTTFGLRPGGHAAGIVDVTVEVGGAGVANQLATRRRDVAPPTVSHELISLFHTGPARNKVTARPLKASVRPLLLLLAAYVLALALVPCGDIVGANPAETGLVAATEASDSEDQLSPGEDTPADDDHHDECTPFCACACCGLQVVVTPRLFLPALPQLVAAPAARPMSAAAAWDSRPLGATSQPPRV